MEEIKSGLDRLASLQRYVSQAMKGKPVEFEDLSNEDIHLLLREVQRQKIQLDIQNEETSQLREQLEKARNKYSDLFDFAPVGYFTIGDNGLILDVNLTGANLLGGTIKSLVNEPFYHFVSKDSLDQYYVHRQQLFESKSRQICELKLVKKDGKQFYAQLDSIVLPDRKGNFSQFQTTILDITERMQAQERLQHQEKMAAVGQLASGIAHDFNNTLQTILGFSELLFNRYQDLPTEVRDGLQYINEQSQSAAILVRQLLDFSRRSMGEQHPVSLAPFLEELLKLLERTIPEKVRLCLDYSPGQYWVKVNVALFEQCLLNLAINARDAMPEGGTLRLSLERQHFTDETPLPIPQMQPGEWIVLRVKDTGTGIPEHIRPHLFEPFFTTKRNGNTGLGLSQVYGIIRRHEGFIDVSSALDKGTEFTIYLPALSMPEAILPDLQAKDLPYGEGETLLLVEDESAVLESVHVTLKHLGYRVLTANSGREALNLYDQHSNEIALVLTDMMMPEMGGLAMAQTLWQKDPSLKVVVLTGYLLESEANELLDEGIFDYLQKPLRIKQLAETIKRSLQSGKSLRSSPSD